MESSQLNEFDIPQINRNVYAMYTQKISRSLFAEHRKIFEFLATTSGDK